MKQRNYMILIEKGWGDKYLRVKFFRANDENPRSEFYCPTAGSRRRLTRLIRTENSHVELWPATIDIYITRKHPR